MGHSRLATRYTQKGLGPRAGKAWDYKQDKGLETQEGPRPGNTSGTIFVYEVKGQN